MEDRQLEYFLKKDKIPSMEHFHPEKELMEKYVNVVITRSADRFVCVFMAEGFSDCKLTVVVENKQTMCSTLVLYAYKSGVKVPFGKKTTTYSATRELDKTSNTFSLSSDKHVSSNPYLGILFSNDLKWSTHIASTTKKASSTLGFLRRNLHFFPHHCKKNAYLALIRPLLEYGCITWSPYLQQDINRLERIQRLSARFITNDYSTRSPGAITNMLSTLELPTLQQRRRDLRLTFFYKVVEGLVPAIPSADILTPSKTGRHIIPRDFKDYASSSAISDHIRNNSRSFQVSRCQTDQFRNSYFVNTVREWNHLDEATVTTSSVESFKARLSDRSI
ncbi:hypothetical protein ACOMHN_026310 [Nucella lapillus]